jgi:divalent metal cation (Fe/Co/Zn/Cd) transporter
MSFINYVVVVVVVVVVDILLTGAVAIFLIRKNTIALLGHTIPPHRKKIILSILEKDPVVKAVYNAKAVRVVIVIVIVVGLIQCKTFSTE